MNEYGLQLSYVPDDEYLGELVATVRTERFSGAGSIWVSRQQVKETFVSALRAYPLSAANLPLLEGEYRDHLHIAIRPYDLKGTLLTHVDLITHCYSTPDHDLQQSVTARFLTTYNALDVFARELDQVLDGHREWATLASRVD